MVIILLQQMGGLSRTSKLSTTPSHFMLFKRTGSFACGLLLQLMLRTDLLKICYSFYLFVTDGGSDIVKALGNFKRIYCAAHALNLIVRGTLVSTYHCIVENILISTPQAKYVVTRAYEWASLSYTPRHSYPRTQQFIWS